LLKRGAATTSESYATLPLDRPAITAEALLALLADELSRAEPD
jgi:hypothetical protein